MQSWSTMNKPYTLIWVLCITIIRCDSTSDQLQQTQAPFQSIGVTDSESSVNSWSNIFDQLQTINPLIWVIVILITLVCCLSGVLICYCALQHKFNKDLTEARTKSNEALQRQLSHQRSGGSTSLPPLKQYRSFSPRPHADGTLHLPHHTPSHDALDPDTSPSPMMIPLPRARSADIIPRPIAINNDSPRNTRHKSAKAGYMSGPSNLYGNASPVQMFTPTYNEPRRESGTTNYDGHTNHNLSITTFEHEYSNGTATEMTYMSSKNTGPPLPPSSMNHPTKQSYSQMKYTQHINRGSLKSIPDQTRAPPPPPMRSLPELPRTQSYPQHNPQTNQYPQKRSISNESYNQQSYPQKRSSRSNGSYNQQMTNQQSYPQKRSSLRSNGSYNQVPISVQKVPDHQVINVNTAPSATVRLNMNLKQALGALPEKNHLTPHTGAKHEKLWTEASIGGMSALTINNETPNETPSEGFVGAYIPHMIGGNKRNDDVDQFHD